MTDVNAAPVITSAATASYAENGTGTAYTVTATDDGENSNTLTYSLSGTDAGLFDINASTGAVTFKASPNYEAPADAGKDNVYNIVVHANDGTADTTQNVAITVTDVSEVVIGTSGKDTIGAGTGATEFDDVIDAGAGSDTIDALGGNDKITGGTGNDVVSAGKGNDTIYAINNDGNDTYSGGDGIDTYDLSQVSAGAGGAGVYVNLAAGTAQALSGGGTIGTDRLSSIENVTGSLGNDTLIGSSVANVIDGGAGNDRLTGGLGDDVFRFTGLFGKDTVTDFNSGTGNAEVLEIDLVNTLGATVQYGGTAYDGTSTLWIHQVSGNVEIQVNEAGGTQGTIILQTTSLSNIDQFAGDDWNLV